MRNLFLFLLTVFGLWSCEWAPQQVELVSETQVRTVNLALGDTLDIDVAGYDLNLEDEALQDIIQFVEFGPSNIRLIGTALGTTQISVSYKLPIIEGPNEVGLMYLDITVTDGFPLELILGEWTTVVLADYLTEAQLLQVDSITVKFAERLNDKDIPVQINTSEVGLQGIYPGIVRVEIVTYDSLGLQIVPLQFETRTEIRTTVLAEIYTNAGCVNCPEANHSIDLLYEAFPENFTAIRYHVFWTDPFDPMNLYNPTEVEDRRVFSGNSYEAPKIYMNGEVVNYADYSGLVSSVSQNISAGADVHIWKPTYMESADSLFIDYKVENFSTPLSDVLIYSVLTQDSIYYEGTNGEKIHMQVMRDITSSVISELSSEVIMSHSLKRVPHTEDTDKLNLVLFVQDMSSRDILQVTDYSVSELLP